MFCGPNKRSIFLSTFQNYKFVPTKKGTLTPDPIIPPILA